jgi:hypothetical protein
MKPRIFSVSICVLLALSFANGQAQDNSRTLGAVDSSVHAGVEEQKQSESLQGVAKRPRTFSSWSSSSSTSQPARSALTTARPKQIMRSDLADTTGDIKGIRFSTFQPERYAGSSVFPPFDHASDSTSPKLCSPTDPFSVRSLPHAQDRSTRLRLSLPALPPYASSETQDFARAFEQQQSGQAFNSFRANLAHGKATKANRSKRSSAKSGNLDTEYSWESTRDRKR